MLSTITVPVGSTEAVIHILIKKAKHRGTNPFIQELSRFLNNPQTTEYYFLSEDYYHNVLHRTNNSSSPFELTIGSSRPEIIARNKDVNSDLNHIKI